jgi:hypothetical protein
MKATNVTVGRVSTKDVNTRFGNKKTYSFQADGAWYSTGFKDSKVVAGSVISFDYETDDYGNQVDINSIVKGTAAAAPAPASGGAKAAPYSGGGKGVFPIPALDGQRSIVRQNALTNAREVLVAASGGKPFAVDIDQVAASTIALARRFEAYTTGDLDMQEVEREAAGQGIHVAEEEKKAA